MKSSSLRNHITFQLHHTHTHTCIHMCRMHMKHLIDARKAGRQTGTGTVAASVSLSLCPSVAVVRQRQQRPLFTNIIPFPAKAITTPSRPLHRRHAHTYTHTQMCTCTLTHTERREGEAERGHMCMSRRHCCDCKHTDRDGDGRTEGLGWHTAHVRCTCLVRRRSSSTYLRSTTA